MSFCRAVRMLSEKCRTVFTALNVSEYFFYLFPWEILSHNALWKVVHNQSSMGEARHDINGGVYHLKKSFFVVFVKTDLTVVSQVKWCVKKKKVSVLFLEFDLKETTATEEKHANGEASYISCVLSGHAPSRHPWPRIDLLPWASGIYKYNRMQWQ